MRRGSLPVPLLLPSWVSHRGTRLWNLFLCFSEMLTGTFPPILAIFFRERTLSLKSLGGLPVLQACKGDSGPSGGSGWTWPCGCVTGPWDAPVRERVESCLLGEAGFPTPTPLVSPCPSPVPAACVLRALFSRVEINDLEEMVEHFFQSQCGFWQGEQSGDRGSPFLCCSAEGTFTIATTLERTSPLRWGTFVQRSHSWQQFQDLACFLLCPWGPGDQPLCRGMWWWRRVDMLGAGERRKALSLDKRRSRLGDV